MLRQEREITDKWEMFAVLERCDTIRLGLFNRDYPYIVPVSFGMEITDEQAVLYIHGAAKGLKVECIRRNPKVCVEADIFYKVETWTHGITTRFESVIATGCMELLEREEEKLHGLRKIVEHYGYPNYPLDQCRGLSHTSVYKIVLEKITGKRNLPAEA